MSERKDITGATEDIRFARSPTRSLVGNGRDRDGQRARVYRAEHKIHGPLGRDEQDTLTFREVVETVREIEQTKWFQDASSNPLIHEATRDWNVTVGDGRRRKTGCAIPAMWEIRIPKGFRCVEVLVHELGHLIAPPDAAGHGPEWVEIYLDGLAAVGMGRRARDLAVEFEAAGVTGGMKPDYYLTVTPEIDLLTGRQKKAEQIRLLKEEIADVPIEELTPEMLTLA